jgi:hypothetical protein
MLRYTLVCVIAAVATFSVLACGDDDDDSSPTPSGATPGETFGDGRTTPPTASVTEPSSNGDDKTAPPSSTNDGQTTPAPTAPGPTPTAPPTASVGTPAPQASPSIVANFEGQQITYEDCSYNPSTAQVTCDDVIYAIDPPIVGQDVTCQQWVIQTEVVLLSCNIFEPFTIKYYEILE